MSVIIVMIVLSLAGRLGLDGSLPPPDACVHQCAGSATRDAIGRVRSSSAFDRALAALRERRKIQSPGARDPLPQHAVESIRRSLIESRSLLLDSLTLVYFEAGESLEATLVYFAVSPREVVLLTRVNAGVLGVGLDTANWNAFARRNPTKLGRDQLRALALGCVLFSMSENESPEYPCAGEQVFRMRRTEPGGWHVSLERLGEEVELSDKGELLSLNRRNRDEP